MGISLQGPPELVSAVRDLLQVLPEQAGELKLKNNSTASLLAVNCRFAGIEKTVEEPEFVSPEAELKRIARLAVIKCFKELYPELLPWGILTGIRPIKIFHRLLEQGLSEEEITEILAAKYGIALHKIKLGLKIARTQQKHLPNPSDRSISVYVGIPFCPSRCTYCSFPSNVGGGVKLKNYLQTLREEIDSLGEALTKRGVLVQTLYLGGGTPTILDEEELAALLKLLAQRLLTPQTVEFTVEAGRPDTLNGEKLRLMHRAGVTRLSINPQTMHQPTLDLIGRKHTPLQIKESFYLAREVGFDNINMDVILGLPGESLGDIEKTLEQISELNPESLTVHALALKKGSPLQGESSTRTVSISGAEAQESAEYYAGLMGMQPYYLYRQKRILDNLDNIGYAKPGRESIYNIQIMEERQSIFGIGAGASSKIVNPRNWKLVNFQHPKQPEAYALRWQGSLGERVRLWEEFNLWD